MKENKGITLVALVVTIVVLIILAVISINAMLRENGLIKKVQQTKDIYEQAKEEEKNRLSNYGDYIDKVIAGGNYTDKYLDNTLPVAPRLAKGMTKVKYNAITDKWEKVTDDSEAWYDYANKEWANVVLGDATWNEDGTLNESKPYAQFVWIPRYVYKITSQYHTSGSTAGDIDVVFIDTNNQGIDGTTYSTTYPNATAGEGMDDYVVHPAFEYGGNHLTGFWMGKFESSNTNCTTDESTGNQTFIGNEIITIRAGVTSWRQISTKDAFIKCLNMNMEGNPYNLSTDDNIVDPHMCKNSEWGACAYLSKSSYGKRTEEVYINNSKTYICGNSGSTASADRESESSAYNTTNGVNASTTGNITGIYDMSGGNAERVAAYIDNEDANSTTTAESLIKGASKYKNLYFKGNTDSQALNYEQASPQNGQYGDAIYETSNSYLNTNSWYSDYSYMPITYTPFFQRGGFCGDTSNAGIFAFVRTVADASHTSGFRVIIAVF